MSANFFLSLLMTQILTKSDTKVNIQFKWKTKKSYNKKNTQKLSYYTWNFAHHHEQETDEDLFQGCQHDLSVLGSFSQWTTGVTLSLLFSCFGGKSIFILTLDVFYLPTTDYCHQNYPLFHSYFSPISFLLY